MASIQKLPSGKFRVQVRKDGVYRAKTFDRKTDARAWGVDVERAISGGANAGAITAPKSMTFSDVIDAYMTQVETRRTTRVNLERLKSRIGATKVRNLSALVMQQFIDSRMNEGVTGATIAGDLSTASSVLRWARRVRQIDVNEDLAAAARRGLTAARIETRSQERTRVPTEDELRRIIEHIESNPRQKIPAATIIRFAAASAMRLGEICRIRIEDISWNEKSVIVRERKDPKRKARNDQTVPLVGDAYRIAREVAGDRREGRLFPYKADSVGAVFTRACRELGIDDLHMHDLRHLAITELFRAGLPIQLVAVVSGHRDWKHLKRYTQLNAGDVHAALERLQ
ncbi:tyrosine-type recombinase/integrase [Aliiruegeria sabulilitoris]|uniref:tyrosine-type recombinase/integrase n=1 Tax=Aliiruegeria sabulilitoris TaxID=1510458 RepID=UPI0009EB9B50|nr:site-specific integrase [Aliiruegeria sabulilitoris]NDR55298.1 site-specific integrase [Pseudoruegeria sp. M32A2M]